jgi:hypothetical protein
MFQYNAFVKIKAAVKLSFSLNFVEKFYNYVVHSKIFAIFKLLGCEAATLFFYIGVLKKSIFYLVNVAGRGVEGPLKKLLRFSCEKNNQSTNIAHNYPLASQRSFLLEIIVMAKID